MQKTYFHNQKHINEKKVKKKIIPLQYNGKKRIVDINILLNRVRVDKIKETKRKIIFYSSSILSLGFFSIFIMFIK
ncbi:hypothetical protein [Candidatus Pelagibacter sp. Uisw_130]|uniref:hypothetical protein n=1 Tax=Candidatus Pelagibacter sp. Uisw_130 TaxID=3230989 RepID=UPI0039EABF80